MEEHSRQSCPTIDILEKGLYFNSNSNTEVKEKIAEFSNFLNSVGRISLINADEEITHEFVFLLLTLKKNIKQTLSELGKSRKRQVVFCECSECNQEIPIEFGSDIWSTLQNHEHFEERFHKFLSGSLESVPLGVETNRNVEAVPSTSNACDDVKINDKTDSKIDQCEVLDEEDVSIQNVTVSSEEDDYGTNDFTFSFKPPYDPEVEMKLYPDSIMKAVRRLDKVPGYSIQRSGPSRGVCLICCCDLMTRSRFSKTAILDHVMGQRHMKFSATPECLRILEAYHEAFTNHDPPSQAHQVYFRPDTSHRVMCILCNKSILCSMVTDHLLTNKHRLQVVDLYKKNLNICYLTNLQVQVYGIVEEPDTRKQEVTASALVNGKATEKPKKNSDEKHGARKKEKKDTIQSPSSDNKESQHLIVKSVENQKSKNVADWIPHRYREHLQFFKENGNILSCQPCKVNLAKDSEMLKKHIRLSSHQGLSKLLVRYTFYCEICNVKFTDEVAWNKHFTEGPNRHVLMAESRKSKVTEYECTKCLMVIFGDELSLARHISDRSRKDKKNEKKEPQLPEQVKRMFKSVENIEAESMKLLDEANNSLNGKQLTQECCTSLEKALSSVFPGCHVHPFGSRISGLGNEHSDLDVFVDTGDMFLGDKNQDPLAQVQLVRKAAAALTKLREEFQEVCQVPTARTPIVKLYHRKARIECDLSFRHGLSVENTKFIRFCIDIQPITQPFILMLKKWSFYNNLQEHITTYALALLAIFYLQINNYLLSVKKIKELNPAEAQTINGWETINYKMPVHQIKNHVSRYEHSISRLLKDFFDYYSKFDYEKQVVCPLLGYTINKNLFEGKGERLPPVMHTYVQQLSSKEPEQFRINSLFCVQDPFDLSHNLTKACQQGIVAKFKNMCGLSWRHLSSLT
ncbi:uncharacterized protein isoform X1 [Leptinotarsa decemlineata]|uniref:uncharacterized protein isoform X1 n=2 Tax=Leptinotarsa decemlineata TaxID=7539 RepID=UPI003D30C4DD